MQPNSRTEIDYGDQWFSIIGPQLHSETTVKMTCRHRGDGRPAAFIFNNRRIEATTASIVNHDERGLTTIGRDGIRIRQVEHILSALYGMHCLDSDVSLEYVGERDDAAIAPPVAHLDASDYVAAIRRSFPERSRRRTVEVAKACVVQDPIGGLDPTFAAIAPHDKLEVIAHLNFPYFWGKQAATCQVNPMTYEREISWARSFFGTPFPHNAEWEALRQQYPGVIAPRMQHFLSQMIDYNDQRWLTPLFAADEPARHKLLDIIGDLALLGSNVNAMIYVYKPYHQFNRHLVAELANQLGVKHS